MSKLLDIRLSLVTLISGESLTEQQAYEAFESIMTGSASEAQIGALLAALQCRPTGPSVDELVGAARVMREHVLPVEAPTGRTVIDTCGTGGVNGVTFNVSTTAAIIAAAAGATVAKHGNRSVTSRSGSSEVLSTLGVNLDADSTTLTHCLEQANICFCFAVNHHPAMRYVVGPRQQLGFHSIFNLLGPLTNPAGAKRQLMGVSSISLLDKLAQVHERLGAERVMLVHGDGQDDIATTGSTHITELKGGQIKSYVITPQEFGLQVAKLNDLAIKGIEASAALIRRVLDGDHGPARDMACLNAAGALMVADLADSFEEGLEKAGAAIDGGHAASTLMKLVEISNGYVGEGAG